MSAVATMDPLRRLRAVAGKAEEKAGASTTIDVTRPELAEAIARFEECTQQAKSLDTEAKGIKKLTLDPAALAEVCRVARDTGRYHAVKFNGRLLSTVCVRCAKGDDTAANLQALLGDRYGAMFESEMVLHVRPPADGFRRGKLSRVVLELWEAGLVSFSVPWKHVHADQQAAIADAGTGPDGEPAQALGGEKVIVIENTVSATETGKATLLRDEALAAQCAKAGAALSVTLTNK